MAIKWLKGFILNAFRIENFVYVYFFFLLPPAYHNSFAVNIHRIIFPFPNLYTFFCFFNPLLWPPAHFSIIYQLFLFNSSLFILFTVLPSAVRTHSHLNSFTVLRYLLNQNVFVRKFYVFITVLKIKNKK